MSFMICFQQNKKARVIGKCNALDAMVLATVVCHATAEKVAIEKKIDKRTAMKIVTESILQNYVSAK